MLLLSEAFEVYGEMRIVTKAAVITSPVYLELKVVPNYFNSLMTFRLLVGM